MEEGRNNFSLDTKLIALLLHGVCCHLTLHKKQQLVAQHDVGKLSELICNALGQGVSK